MVGQEIADDTPSKSPLCYGSECSERSERGDKGRLGGTVVLQYRYCRNYKLMISVLRYVVILHLHHPQTGTVYKKIYLYKKNYIIVCILKVLDILY